MSDNNEFLTRDEIKLLLQGMESSKQADEAKEEENENKYKKAIEALEEIIKDIEIEDGFYDKYDDPEEFVAVIKDVISSSHEDKLERSEKSEKSKKSEMLSLDARIAHAKERCHFS